MHPKRTSCMAQSHKFQWVNILISLVMFQIIIMI